MKAILDPVWGNKYGWDLSTSPTDEFRELLNKAESIIEPFVDKTSSDVLVYYKVKDDDVGEYDTCNNQKCINAAKAKIREEYGKYTRVTEQLTSNDGDHEDIQLCWNCAIPLNEFLTWCDSEMEYLEQNYPLSWDFIKQEAFVIHAILQSSPTCDAKLGSYRNYSPEEPKQEDLDRREQFFQRIVFLAESVLATSQILEKEVE